MTLIEKAARAAWEERRRFAAGHSPPVLLEEWEDGVIPLANNIIAEVRAVLESLLEPSEAMIRAGTNAVGRGGGTYDEQARKWWQAMLRVALEEQPEGNGRQDDPLP